MSEGGRGRRILLSCLGGCAALALLLIGSCVAATVWVNTPGDVLETERLFDPTASGFVEWQLRLEDEGTEEIIAAAARLSNRQDDLPQSRLLQTLFQFNQRRQERELRQLFPAAAAWVSYPPQPSGEPTGDLFSVSVARMAKQGRIADWIFARVSGWASDIPTVRYNGELILSVDEPDGQFHGFLHPLGAFWGTRLEVAQRAVDALAESERSRAVGTPSELQREYDSLPPASIRGVLTNRGGHLAQRLQTLLDDSLNEETVAALEQVDLVRLHGGPVAGGSVELTLDLRSDPALLPVVQAAVDQLLTDVGDDLPLEGRARSVARGVEVELILRDLPQALDDFGRNVSERIESAVEEAAANQEQ